MFQFFFFFFYLFFFSFFFFFFNDTATTEIYTLSLHDALPILLIRNCSDRPSMFCTPTWPPEQNPAFTTTNVLGPSWRPTATFQGARAVPCPPLPGRIST